MALRGRDLVPFLIVPARNRSAVTPELLPTDSSPLFEVDPQKLEHREFLSLVQKLDDLTFSPMGLEMPGWVFYDCGVMPGIVLGYGAKASKLRPWIRRVLGVKPGYEGLVPLTLFIAIAMLPERSWLVNTLTGLDDVAPGATVEGLVRRTLAAGLFVLPVDHLYGTVQWRSRTLPRYTALGALQVLTAWTPAHDILSTLTFKVDLSPNSGALLWRGVEGINPETPAPNRVVDVDNSLDLQAVQSWLEDGAKVELVAPPLNVGRHTLGLLRYEKGGVDDS